MRFLKAPIFSSIMLLCVGVSFQGKQLRGGFSAEIEKIFSFFFFLLFLFLR